MDEVARTILTDEQYERYKLYMETKGNYPELFSSEQTIAVMSMPLAESDTFSKVKAEAEKFLGYPYGATCSQLKRLGTCPMIGGEKKDR